MKRKSKLMRKLNKLMKRMNKLMRKLNKMKVQTILLKSKRVPKNNLQNILTQTFEVLVMLNVCLKETFQMKTLCRWSLKMDGAHSTTVHLGQFTSRNLTSNLQRNIQVTIKEQQYGFMIHLLTRKRMMKRMKKLLMKRNKLMNRKNKLMKRRKKLLKMMNKLKRMKFQMKIALNI